MTRKATENDLPFIFDLYMHPQSNPHLMYEKMELEQFQPIFQDLLKDEIKYIFEDNQQMIGMFKLIPLKFRSSHIAYLGGLAIHSDFVGKGFGLKMMNAIINLAAEKGILRIELSAGIANKRAIELYKRAGFVEEGVLRKYTHLKSEGRFIDEVLMSYIMD
ncbi:GNAT family protein [Arcicella sp. LKC2W]|uniref:GNAT family N-acetyltransferase n=1 Tax=Arcicella sp. LKC2W TaxID=2984198 RepID=UPI002B209B9E|nr:GNAT family protein [Arcicella sp. LKC2W]MEA5461233.1 GNAT family protein [Arcicella sp. LKC2W]